MPIKEYFKGRGEKVMRLMTSRYGPKAGKRVFYATANKQGMTPGARAMLKAGLSAPLRKTR